MTLRVHGDALVAKGTLDFAVNVWPGPRAPALERALHAALDDARYPDPGEATQAIAARHARSPDEVLPLVDRPSRLLAPGARGEIVRHKAMLTTTTPHSHLLSFAEYATMYLFAWSDVLWPDEVPTAEDVWG